MYHVSLSQSEVDKANCGISRIVICAVAFSFCIHGGCSADDNGMALFVGRNICTVKLFVSTDPRLMWTYFLSQLRSY